MVPNSHSVIARGEGWGNTNAIGHEKTLCADSACRFSNGLFYFIYFASKEPDVSLSQDRVNIGFKFIS